MSKIQKINRKQYYNIDATTSSDDIFAILYSVDRENEEDIENLMNDSGTEFVVVTEEEEEKIILDGNVTQEQGSILRDRSQLTSTKKGGGGSAKVDLKMRGEGRGGEGRGGEGREEEGGGRGEEGGGGGGGLLLTLTEEKIVCI